MTDTAVLLTVDPDESLTEAIDQIKAVLGANIDKQYEEIPETPARNAKHAARAAVGVLAYAHATSCPDEPIEQVIRDLLSDLMHLTDLFLDSDRENVEFDSLVSRAYGNYSDEVGGEV